MPIELVPLELIDPADVNPNRGDVDQLVETMATLGWWGTVVLNRAGTRFRDIAGEHRVHALRRLNVDGWTDPTGTHWQFGDLPIRGALPQAGHVWADVHDIDADHAHAMLIADNRTRDRAVYDDETLLRSLDDLAKSSVGLLGSGWASDELDQLREAAAWPGSAGPDSDASYAPEDDEPPSAPVTHHGDLWMLGEHRLLCGDAFATDDRARLLRGWRVAAGVMDPPFAIYGSASGISSSVADDKMVRPFFEQLGRALMELVPKFGHVYVCCDWRSYATLWEGFKLAGLTPKNCLVWDKGGAGLGNNWSNAHEFVAYFAKLPKQQTMTSGAEAGQRPVLRSNLLRYPRVTGAEREHNAAKPVPLLAELITAATDEGAVVLDLFGGSGSTLIAAQTCGRRCAMMELEPAWCDVIVRRWHRLTGATPHRNGEPVELESV